MSNTVFQFQFVFNGRFKLLRYLIYLKVYVFMLTQWMTLYCGFCPVCTYQGILWLAMTFMNSELFSLLSDALSSPLTIKHVEALSHFTLKLACVCLKAVQHVCLCIYSSTSASRFPWSLHWCPVTILPPTCRGWHGSKCISSWSLFISPYSLLVWLFAASPVLILSILLQSLSILEDLCSMLTVLVHFQVHFQAHFSFWNKKKKQ